MTTDDERSDPDVSFTFDRDPHAPRAARRALDPLLEPGDAFAETVKLAASEMVSNVVQHTADGGRLDAWDDDPLLIEVTDHEPTPPVLVVEPREVGGRGLMIVDHAADQWGVVPTPAGGKVVWARFRRPGSPGPNVAGAATDADPDPSMPTKPKPTEGRVP